MAFLKEAHLPLLAVPAALLLPFLSFIFWKLDRRNRELIQHAEEALKLIECDVPSETSPQALRLFHQEDEKTAQIRKKDKLSGDPRTWLRGHYSYYDCFRVVFFGIGLLGLAILVSTFFVGAPHQGACSPTTEQTATKKD
jgi:hypothetical protein